MTDIKLDSYEQSIEDDVENFVSVKGATILNSKAHSDEMRGSFDRVEPLIHFE